MIASDSKSKDLPPKRLNRSTQQNSSKCQNYSLKVATMVAHFVCALFVGFVVYTAVPGSSLFSWHPTLMVIAFGLLMTEAILFFSPQSSLFQNAARSTKTKLHWSTMITVLILAGGGFLAIFLNKIDLGKPHFQTWHGLIGLITLIYICVQMIGGAVQMWYPHFVKKLYTLKDLKMMHATSGLIAFSLVCFSLFLGMWSNWFTKNVTGTSWYACAACPMILALVVMTQITTAYLPQPRIQRPVSKS